jgi:hypothetical protein
MKTQISITNIKPKDNTGGYMPELNEEINETQVDELEEDGVEEELVDDDDNLEDEPDSQDEATEEAAQE